MGESLKILVEIEKGRVEAEGVLGRCDVWDADREDNPGSGRGGDSMRSGGREAGCLKTVVQMHGAPRKGAGGWKFIRKQSTILIVQGSDTVL